MFEFITNVYILILLFRITKAQIHLAKDNQILCVLFWTLTLIFHRSIQKFSDF